MGAARPRARSRGAVSARGVPDGGQQICKIWRPVVLRCEPGGRRRDRLKCHSRGWDRQYVSILLKRLAGELQCDNTSPRSIRKLTATTAFRFLTSPAQSPLEVTW